MNIQDLRQRGTILASIPLRRASLELGTTLNPMRMSDEVQDRVYADRDNDRALDFIRLGNSNLEQCAEPIVHEDFQALKKYAELNQTGPIVSKEEVGELTTCTAYKSLDGKGPFTEGKDGAVFRYRGPWSELTRELSALNPLPNHSLEGNIEWAIDLRSTGSSDPGAVGQLYIFAPK